MQVVLIHLSVNVNKIATLRNARGGATPSVIAAADTCLDAGAAGITVHPRADERHIRAADVRALAARLAERVREGRPRAEFNIEGDPREAFIDLVLETRPDQCTLVPVTPGEITSHAGWPADARSAFLPKVVGRLQDAGIRVSVFIDPEEDAVRWAAGTGAERVELYTEPFAKAYAEGGAARDASLERYARAARLAHDRGLGVNAGHDLDLENLTRFRSLPHLEEVSIGHALVSHALWVGLDRAVRDYLAVLGGA
jgi:pyridoxine 5-phosphate synthase